MSKFRLAFGLHNHQPVGNFDSVFDEAHRMAYQPFLDIIKNYPEIRFSLHQSGILWDWQEKHYPQYLKDVNALVQREQVELLNGGFYEPILTSIPERDIEGQFIMLKEYLQRHFNSVTEGCWLTERIWEPHLPKVLNRSGVKYLPVDDTHFIYAGLEESKLRGPFITEYENYAVTLLPISKKLRYLIPFGTIEKLFDYIKSEADKNPGGMLIYADDGEKFGSWPKTHEHCYTEGWLRDFFDAVASNSDWLEIVPLKEAASEKPVGRVYLPSASYAEMLHWALPTKAFVEYEQVENYLKEQQLLEKYGRFVRGGHWRGFLTKYEEANLMQKKMMMVSEKIASFEQSLHKKSDELENAKDKLYAAQCNCPYWHGVFGGLYLPHIRQAIYSNLVEADMIISELTNKTMPSINVNDFDKDGFNEIIFESEYYSSIFKPKSGGMMVELSANKHLFSLTDTLKRRREGYHQKLSRAVTPDKADGTASIHDLVLAKEDGLEQILQDDKYLKRCFIDHVFEDDVNFEQFLKGDFNCKEKLFDINYDAVTNNRNIVTLTCSGKNLPLQIMKQFTFKDDVIEVEYDLSTIDKSSLEINFAVENNFNFQAGHAEDRFITIDGQRHENSFLDSLGCFESVNGFKMSDLYRNLAVELTGGTKSDIWHMPIFTVSLSEGGFEKVYQGTTFVNRYRLKVSGEPVKLSFRLISCIASGN